MLRGIINNDNGNSPFTQDAILFDGDLTGATNVASALETAVLNNPGKIIKIPDNATILLEEFGQKGILNNTADVFIDFGKATILQTNNLNCINISNLMNASAEIAVTSVLDTTVNSDAPTTQITLATTSNGVLHDWYAIYSADANPSKAGGFLGEMHQTIANETGLKIYTAGYMWKTALFTTSIKVRKLDRTRRLRLRGGYWKPNGNPLDPAIIDREACIKVFGFVDPEITDQVFQSSWSQCRHFQCCAGVVSTRHRYIDAENTANYGGYTYGDTLYGMNGNATVSEITVRNGRHAAVTTDGSSGGSTTWYNKGYPTNHEITNIRGYNNHGSLVDEHEEAAGGVYSNVRDHTGVKGTITAFTGCLMQIRGYCTTLTGFSSIGGTRGVKVHAIDHGMPGNDCDISGGVIRNKDGGPSDSGRGIEIVSQVGLVNKVHVDISDVRVNKADVGISVGELAPVSISNYRTKRVTTAGVAKAGSTVILSQSRYDFRGMAAGETTPWKLYSDVTNGGATVIEMTKPNLIKGDFTSQPTHFFGEGDTTATKRYYLPGLSEVNMGAFPQTLLVQSGASTLTQTTTVNQIYNVDDIAILGNRLATIGTSLVQQNNSGTSTPKISFWSRGWLPWARFYSRGRFRHPVWHDPTVITGWEPSGTPGATRYFQGLNFGVSGQTYAQIEARLAYIQTNYAGKFDIIIVDAGTNDMTSQTKEDIQAARERICQFFLAMNVVVILLPILARDITVSGWEAGTAARKKANWINSKSRQFVNGVKNLYLFDWNQSWVNGNNANGIPLPNYSPDGTHFAPAGGEAIGYQLSQFLSTILPDPNNLWRSPDDIYDATDNPLGNMHINPALTGTSGPTSTGVTGTFASNWRVTRNTGTVCSVVGSKEVRADNRGENQVLTFTLSGTTEELFYFAPQAADITHSLGGKYVSSSFEIESNASDGITGITIYHRDQNGTSPQTGYDMEPFDDGAGNYLWAARARTGLLQSEIKLANNSTLIRTRVEIRVKGGGSVAPIIKIGCPVERQVPNPATNTY